MIVVKSESPIREARSSSYVSFPVVLRCQLTSSVTTGVNFKVLENAWIEVASEKNDAIKTAF